MSDIIVFDQWVNPIQDLGSYDGPEMDYQLVLNTMNDKTQDLNLTITKGNDSVVVSSVLVDRQSVSHQTDSVDRQPVSHQIIGPKYLTKSCLQPKQSELDQDDVKIVVPKSPVMFASNLLQNDRTLLNGKRFMDLPIKTCLIPVLNRS